MSLEQLWAGWRASYVSSVTDSSAPEAQGTERAPSALPPARAPRTGIEEERLRCVFCRILTSKASDEERRVVHVSRWAVALLNAYPYSSGHLLILPRRHVSSLGDLGPDESAGVWEMVRAAVAAQERAYRPDGVNIGANLGRAAGAGIPAHLHLHAVPRWIGDTNFMTSIAETRVLPESLDASWARLHAAWAS